MNAQFIKRFHSLDIYINFICTSSALHHTANIETESIDIILFNYYILLWIFLVDSFRWHLLFVYSHICWLFIKCLSILLQKKIIRFYLINLNVSVDQFIIQFAIESNNLLHHLNDNIMKSSNKIFFFLKIQSNLVFFLPIFNFFFYFNRLCCQFQG